MKRFLDTADEDSDAVQTAGQDHAAAGASTRARPSA
jgi:hypothetical protein